MSKGCDLIWLKLMFVELVMSFNHLILCCPLLLLSSFFPSIGVFSNESVLHIRWPKYWSFSFSISPSNEYSGLISFRMDWLDLLAVQRTLKRIHLPMQEMWVRSLGWEDPLGEGMKIHSSIFPWIIPWREEPGGPLDCKEIQPVTPKRNQS